MDEKLMFDRTSGVGTLHCVTCGHMERILSFTHGENHQLGFQCSTCHQYVTIENGLHVLVPPCPCGGKLTREEPLCCPVCQSEDVTYELEYLT